MTPFSKLLNKSFAKPLSKRFSALSKTSTLTRGFNVCSLQVDNCALVMLVFCFASTLTVFQVSVFSQTILLSLLVLFISTTLVLLLINSKATPLIRSVLSCLTLFVFALVWSNWHYQSHVNQILPADLQGKSILVTGKIIGLPDNKNGNSRFRFIVNDSAQQSLIQRKLQLSCYRCPLELATGQVWELTVRLKRPRGYASWGAFDYEKYLFRHRVAATGYVRLKEFNQNISSDINFFTGQRDTIRQLINRSAMQTEKSKRLGFAIIQALTIGDKSGFSSAQREVFQDTGISHLMAISGLHVGLVFMFVSVLVGRLLWPVAGLFEFVPRQTIVLFPALLAAFYYSGLAGFSVPTQRAFIMLSIYVLAKLLARPPSLLRVLLIGATFILLIDPFSVLDMGFWLSCMAVFIIGLSQKPVDDSARDTATSQLSLIRLQPIIWLGMLPLTATLFGQVSLVSPLVNLLMVPLFCLVLIPATLFALSLLLVGLTGLSHTLFSWLAVGFNYVYQLLEFISQLSFANYSISPLSVYELIGCVVVVALFFIASGWRYLALILLALSIIAVGPSKPHDEMRIALIDVGQGLAMVVESGEYVLVYDTGPKYRTGFTAASATLIPYLNSRGIQQIDTLIISHADNDHIGGYQIIADQFDVLELLTSRPEKLPDAQNCIAGQFWEQGDSQFTMISPSINTPKGSNNHSCVLMIEHHGVRTLITGDIEKQVERFLLKSGVALNADIMLVPHQGSKTSSTAEFIDSVSPKLALLAAGYRNHYGHPHKDVVQRYQTRNIKTLSTIESGSILLKIRNNQWQVEKFRNVNKAFWHDQKMPNISG